MAVTIDRTFMPESDRYYFDIEHCSASEGWAQIDTRQDASYHGTWCNPFLRKIVNYAEGDVTTTSCDTDQEFIEQITNLKAWCDATGDDMRIDPGWPLAGECVSIAAKLEELGLGELLH